MPVPSIPADKPFRRVFRVMLVLAWCGVIFAASDQPDLRVSEDDALDLVLRKFAHVLVFGVLAVLALCAARPADRLTPTAVAVAWLGTLAWAISDEWHQTFVDGRVGHPSDVAIDMAGATVALAAWLRWRRTNEAGAHT